MASRTLSSSSSASSGLRLIVAVLTALAMVLAFMPNAARATTVDEFVPDEKVIDFYTAPQAPEPTCDTPGKLIVPDTTGEPYTTTVSPEYNPGDIGTFTVTSTAVGDRYFLDSNQEPVSSISFTFTVKPQLDCEPESPVVEEPVVEEPEQPTDPQPPVVEEPVEPQPDNGKGADVAWSKHGQEHANPACDYGQASQFHYVLAPKGVKLMNPGTLTVTFADGTESTSNGDLKANGAAHYYADSGHDATAVSAVVTGANWTGSGSPQLVLSDSSCLGDAAPQPEQPTDPQPDNGEEPVEPQPENPGVTAFSKACVQQDERTGVVEGTVGNPNDVTVNYDVILEGGPKSYNRHLSVTAREAAGFTFDKLPVGSYTIQVTGDDGTGASTTVTVEECAKQPEPPANPDPVVGPDPVVDPQPELPASPDADDFEVYNAGPSCFSELVTVFGSYQHGEEVAVALSTHDKNGEFTIVEDSIERPYQGYFELTGESLEPGESRDYQVTSSFLDDTTGTTVILEFTAIRPIEAECEQFTPLPIEQQVTVSAECGAAVFTNNADEAVMVLYGSYLEPEPDGEIAVEPGQSARVETTREQLDWQAYTLSDYRFAGESGEVSLEIPQDCGVTPPPANPDDDNDTPQQPATPVVVTPVVKVPVTVVVPKFGAPKHDHRPTVYICADEDREAVDRNGNGVIDPGDTCRKKGDVGKRYHVKTGIEDEPVEESAPLWVLGIAVLLALLITFYFRPVWHRNRSDRQD